MNELKYVYTVEIDGELTPRHALRIIEDAFNRQIELENEYQAPVSVEFENMNRERKPAPISNYA